MAAPKKMLCAKCARALDFDGIKVGQIKLAVAHEFGLPVAAISSTRRENYLIGPRFAAMWLCRMLLPALSYPAIAREFEGRDHTSVMYAVQRFPDFAEADPIFAGRVEKLRIELVEDIGE